MAFKDHITVWEHYVCQVTKETIITQVLLGILFATVPGNAAVAKVLGDAVVAKVLGMLQSTKCLEIQL